MTAIALTTTQIAPVSPQKAKIKSVIAAAAITAGAAVYFTTEGKAALATSTATDAAAQFRGIALKAANTGGAVDVLQEGEVYGYTVSGLNCEAAVYLDTTAGVLADTAGTATVIVGRVAALADKSLTKVLSVFIRPSADWS